MTRDDYLRSPNLCRECDRPIVPRPGQRLSEVRLKQFCNRACAARHNNRTHPKRILEGRCAVCGAAIAARRRYCGTGCEATARRATARTTEERKRDLVTGVVTWRQRLKARAVDYKGGRCQLCGYDRCLQALHFHHQDPSQKDFTVSGKTKAWEDVRIELDKCLLLCANCHAEVHAGIVNAYLPR